MHHHSIALLVASSLALSCASIINGTRQEVSMASNPPHVEIVILNREGEEVYRGRTPATVNLYRGSSYFSREIYTLAFLRPSSEPLLFRVEGSLDPWYFANFVIGGAIGMLIIDPLTGGMYELPEKIAADLATRRATDPPPDDQGGIRVISMYDVPTNLRSKLVPMPAQGRRGPLWAK